jgi:hypothetical protein
MSEKKTSPSASSAEAPQSPAPAQQPSGGGSYVRDPATGQLMRQHRTERGASRKDRRNGPQGGDVKEGA